MQYYITDGGRSELGVNETRDCTVRAMALASAQSYGIAHKVLAKHGRKNRRGVVFQRIAHDVASDLGLEFKLVARSGTVAKLAQNFPNKRLVVRIRGHLFFMRDGIIFDNGQQTTGLCRVKQAWEASFKPIASPEICANA